MNCFAKTLIGLALALAATPAFAGYAAPVSVEVPASSASGPNLYVFRSVAYPLLSHSTLKVDGVKVASLGNHSWTSVHLGDGVHHISFEKSLLTGGVNLKFDIEVIDQKAHFIEYSGDFGTDGVGIRINGETREIPEDIARKMMAAYRQIHPAGAPAS